MSTGVETLVSWDVIAVAPFDIPEVRLRLAQYDLETMEVIFTGKRYLYVESMCHQVIEKALNTSVWALTGNKPEYTHALARLLRGSGSVGEIPGNLSSLVDVLEPLNVEARYSTNKER